MKKIFLDTNFIIDLILRDEYKLSCKYECIITRNKKDFGFSDIPVFTAEEFLQKLI